jgi:hypothetical protein
MDLEKKRERSVRREDDMKAIHLIVSDFSIRNQRKKQQNRFG